MLKSIPKRDMILVMENFIVKVGGEEGFRRALGRHDLHRTFNNNVIILVTLALEHELVIAGTVFQKGA